MARVTRPGGAIWLFFTPHFSPLGSHLYDYIYVPWCHLLFSRASIRRAIGAILSRRHPDWTESGQKRRVEEIMASYDRDLNHMSVRWFFRIVGRERRGLRVSLRELRPAKFASLGFLTRVPLIRELFTGTVVCRLERTA